MREIESEGNERIFRGIEDTGVVGFKLSEDLSEQGWYFDPLGNTISVGSENGQNIGKLTQDRIRVCLDSDEGRRLAQFFRQYEPPNHESVRHEVYEKLGVPCPK